jgi:prephenate dehydrogenase
MIVAKADFLKYLVLKIQRRILKMSEVSKQSSFKRVTIIGTGVLGCSIASLLRGRAIAEEVMGVDSDPAHLEMAKRLGYIDRQMTDLGRGVMGADVVVLAVPLDEVFIVCKKIGPDLRPGAILTCVAGTTYKIWQQIVDEVEGTKAYVPTFPLIYSNSHGPGGASPSILDGQECLVASYQQMPKETIERVEGFWMKLGMKTKLVVQEEFESHVAGCHLLPLITTSLMSQMAKDHGWSIGDTLLAKRFKGISAKQNIESTYQLYAEQVRKLLREIGDQMTKIRKDLGDGD